MINPINVDPETVVLAIGPLCVESDLIRRPAGRKTNGDGDARFTGALLAVEFRPTVGYHDVLWISIRCWKVSPTGANWLKVSDVNFNFECVEIHDKRFSR